MPTSRPVLNGLAAVFLVFAGSLALSTLRLANVVRRVARAVSVFGLVASIWATLAAAVCTMVLLGFHVRYPGDGGFFAAIGYGGAARAFDRRAGPALLGATLAAAAWLVGRWIWRFATRLRSNRTRSGDDRPVLTAAAVSAVVVILGSVGWLGWRLALAGGLFSGWIGLARRRISWPLVIVAAWLVRRYLLQYVGDVVAYVQSQVLDRFYALRQQIKETVSRRARLVYTLPEQYADVIVVGHSLGSVIAYDALNQLLLEESLVPNAPAIKSRTRLLLTVASPLDKTAFLFGVQGTGNEVREALAASVQPLISDTSGRPRWINVFSPWDAIGGELSYYDLPGRPVVPAVDNRPDPDADVLLLAHQQHWRTPLMFQTILEHLV